MADADDQDDELGVGDLVDDAVVTPGTAVRACAALLEAAEGLAQSNLSSVIGRSRMRMPVAL
jgi:hypothetical protein